MATIVGQHVNQFGLWGADTGGTYSYEINFPPSFIVAQIALSYVGTDGSDLARAAIEGYRHRDTPNGAETAVEFGGTFYLPNYLAADKITSVTFSLRVTPHTDADVALNIYFWE